MSGLVLAPLLSLLSCSVTSTLAANALKGLTVCMNDQDCLGVHRQCSHRDQAVVGRCVCQPGYTQLAQDSVACAKKEEKVTTSVHVSCKTDADCKRSEMCISWKYDSALEFARKLRSRISPEAEVPEKHQFCIDAWIIYKNHLESLNLDEPRTGGGLRSRNFDPDEYFFSGRRPPRVQQQYIGFAEDMMLILFLVCILATLVTVHRAACYRSLQDARRNSPLRHILPIAEDRPPPYTGDTRDSADGLAGPLPGLVAAPKPASETPPPSYEEALYRQAGPPPAVTTPPPPPTATVQVTSPEAAPDAAPAPAPAEAGTSEVREEAGAGAEAAHCATPLLDTEEERKDESEESDSKGRVESQDQDQEGEDRLRLVITAPPPAKAAPPPGLAPACDRDNVLV